MNTVQIARNRQVKSSQVPRVMIVEDEDAIVMALRYNLEAAGYEIEACGRGDEAEIRLQEELPDLLLLDWALPGVSGIELCRRLRARPQSEQLPIIMLTAKGEENDRVRGLNTGADDYITKPFSMPELIARIQVILRRVKPAVVSDLLKVCDIELDRGRHKVKRAGRDIHLGPTEFRLLEFLMQSPGRVFSRGQLLDSVWGRDVYVDERTVDVHVGRLRKAISQASGSGGPIRTVRGAGYALDETFA